MFLSLSCERGWLWKLIKEDPILCDITISSGYTSTTQELALIEIWEGKTDDGNPIKSIDVPGDWSSVWVNVEPGNYFVRASFYSEEDILKVPNECWDCDISVYFSMWDSIPGISLNTSCY